MPPTRILLIDDHQLILDSLQTLFSSISNIHIVGKFNDSRYVSDWLAQNSVDVVICDLRMPHLSGIELTILLRKKYPSIKVLLLSMTEDLQIIREAIRSGVGGYVLKRSGRDELEKAITTIMQGNSYFSNDILTLLTDQETDKSTNSKPLTTLTEREIDVLRLIVDENPTHQIAQKLFISVPTVETHRRHLMQKLNVRSVVGMVKFAMRYGLAS